MHWKKIKETDPQYVAKLCEAALILDADRRLHQKETDLMELEVKEVKEKIRLHMNTAGMSEVVTKAGTVRLVPKTVYQPDTANDGWAKIWAFIIKNKAVDLLEKRLHQGACKERYEDKKQIPGVKTFDMVYIKLGDAE
jgi:hypothetical protein